MNPNFRNFALWVVIFLLVLALVTLFQNPGHRGGGSEIAYSQLLNDADAGKIQSVVISGQDVSGTYVGGGNFTSYAPNDPSLVSKLQGKGVQITARPPSDNTPWFIQLLVSWLPILVFIGAWIFLSRQMQSGDQSEPPYRSVLDAMRDGWFVLQVPTLPYFVAGREHETGHLPYEYVLERTVTLDDNRNAA